MDTLPPSSRDHDNESCFGGLCFGYMNRSRKINGPSNRLNVYDLNESNSYLYPLGLGFYHSGVVIGSTEYTFGSGSGIFNHSPKEAPSCVYRETVDYGCCDYSQKQIEGLISEMRQDFGGDSYHIMMKNCNAFSDALLQKILNRSIPGYVNRTAYIGSLFSFCFPPSLSGISGQQQQITDSNPAYVPFGGTGNKVNNGKESVVRVGNADNSIDEKSKESLRDLRLRALQVNSSVGAF